MSDATLSDPTDPPATELPSVPRTFLEALQIWEVVRLRNLEIRRRFQEGREKGVLLPSAAMRPSWQT